MHTNVSTSTGVGTNASANPQTVMSCSNGKAAVPVRDYGCGTCQLLASHGLREEDWWRLCLAARAESSEARRDRRGTVRGDVQYFEQ